MVSTVVAPRASLNTRGTRQLFLGHTKDPSMTNLLRDRLAELVGGVAIVKGWAATETAMKEKKARVRGPGGTSTTVDTMNNRSDETIVHDLRELIAALDRRVPRLEREGELDIVHDAETLRRAALRRIAELDPPPSVPPVTTLGEGNA